MKLLTAPRSRRTVVALIATAVVVLFVTGVGVYGLIVGTTGHGESTGPVSPATEHDPEPSNDPDRPAPRNPAIPHSTDADTFARSVATALFTWDTGSGFLPLDYTKIILDVADPSSTEQPGLAADLAIYLPSHDAWTQLRQYATKQHLEITSAYVPDAWGDALAQAQRGQLPDGGTAFTIEGIRHRSGDWDGDPVSADQQVAFTVFIACPPKRTCHVLRLSQLNNPLR